MNMLQQLLESIASDLHILKGQKESKEEWTLRIIYSAIARNGYCSLWDLQDDDTTIIHFKKRCNEQLLTYIRIYPELRMIVSNQDIAKNIIDKIYDLYLKNGFFLHRKNYITNSRREEAGKDGCCLLKSPLPSDEVFMSGIGYYSFEQLTGDFKSMYEVFGLSQVSISTYLEKLLNMQTFKEIELDTDIEYLKLNPPFSNGYWQKQKHENKISLLRIGPPENKMYYLYKIIDDHVMASRLPEWMVNKGEYRMIAWGLLNKYSQVPNIEYVVLDERVLVHLNYLLPVNEQSFFELYSWPESYATLSSFNRIMNKEVFEIIKIEFERIGFVFQEGEG